MTAKKKVVKKSSAKKGKGASVTPITPRTAPDATPDREVAEKIRTGEKKPEPPKIHAKTLSVIISVGSHDRKRSIEDFQAWVEKALEKVPYGEDGHHVAVTGAHYILDGAVCMPQDYDPKTQNFKPGATPPPWAGGPSPKHNTIKTQLEKDLEELTPDQYDKKYGLGKYKDKGKMKVITPEMQRRAIEEHRAFKARMEDEGLEEFEWDEGDLDEASLGEEADKQTKRAVKKMTSGKSKKRVVKKSTAATKPVTKRVVKKGKKK